MQSRANMLTVVKVVGWIAAAMIVIVVFHLGGIVALRVGQFSPLTGALIGGTLTLACALTPIGKREQVERWIKNEQIAWILIGCGILMWGFGESFWRYYISIGQQPFPSTADIGYSSFPPLVFLGLLLQPSPGTGNRRLLLALDSLIAMGSILALAWYLLLGSLAQMPGEANLAKFLGLYYPVADMALLSCVVFLLLRGQGRTYLATARRAGLLVIGLGLCFFVFSDFLFNVQNNAGTYVEATWIDLGWPLGMMTIGIAALLRRFLPVTPVEVIEERMDRLAERSNFGISRYIPYILLCLLFIALTANVLSSDSGQIAIRPVLLFATMGVVALVVVRQLLTLWENTRLATRQAEALEDLGYANQRIEEQARHIAEHSAELERGIAHLKHVQAQLANGNLQARAELTGGVLLPLAGSLNLMAERIMRLGQNSIYTQRLLRALNELSIAIERAAGGGHLVVPASSREFVEINRLLVAMRVSPRQAASPAAVTPVTPPVRAFRAAPPLSAIPTTPSPVSRSLPVSGLASGPLRSSIPVQSTPADGIRSLPVSEPLPPLQHIQEAHRVNLFGERRDTR
jgi:prefoldin subunit 5